LAARYFARTNPELGLYGDDAFTSSEVDCWIDYATTDLTTTDDDKFAAAIDEVNTHLRLRTSLVGHDIGLADAVAWATLAGMVVLLCSSMGLLLKSFLLVNPSWVGIISSNKRIKYKFVSRWWFYLESLDAIKEARTHLPQEVKEDVREACPSPVVKMNLV